MGEEEFVAFQAEGEHQEWTMGQTNLKAGVANVSFTVARLAGGMNAYISEYHNIRKRFLVKKVLGLFLQGDA